MKKLLITLLVICYSCTLFSQNSMNELRENEYVDIEDNYYDYNSGYLYRLNRIPEKYFLIELDTVAVTYSTSTLKTVKIVKNIKLKKGRYFYTNTQTLRKHKVDKFGNYHPYKDISIRFEYNINYNGNEYEITKRTYKNNKLKRTSYFNDPQSAEVEAIEEIDR